MFIMLFIKGQDLFFQLAIFLFSWAFISLTPLIITTPRDFKVAAHLLNAIEFSFFSNLVDNPIFHFWGFEKAGLSQKEI